MTMDVLFPGERKSKEIYLSSPILRDIDKRSGLNAAFTDAKSWFCCLEHRQDGTWLCFQNHDQYMVVTANSQMSEDSAQIRVLSRSARE